MTQGLTTETTILKRVTKKPRPRMPDAESLDWCKHLIEE